MSILSFEAEYRSLAAVVCETQWLCFLLKDMGIMLAKPSTFFCDNKLAIAIGENFVFHETAKHIEIDCHVVREKAHQAHVHLFSQPSDR